MFEISNVVFIAVVIVQHPPSSLYRNETHSDQIVQRILGKNGIQSLHYMRLTVYN